MKLFISAALICLSSVATALNIGDTAPNFTLKNAYDKDISLTDYKGKTIVLEWYAHNCPFVQKHYKSGNMPALQKYYTDKDVVWLSINSSGADHPYFHDNEKALEYAKTYGTASTELLKDPTGEVGKAYKAVTTPHMYIITAEGKLAYQGAIDSIPSFRQEDLKEATNYVKEALDAISTHQKIKTTQTRPYGCSVKYAD